MIATKNYHYSYQYAELIDDQLSCYSSKNGTEEVEEGAKNSAKDSEGDEDDDLAR